MEVAAHLTLREPTTIIRIGHDMISQRVLSLIRLTFWFLVDSCFCLFLAEASQLLVAVFIYLPKKLLTAANNSVGLSAWIQCPLSILTNDALLKTFWISASSSGSMYLDLSP